MTCATCGRARFDESNQLAALRDVPKGPVLDLVRELVGRCVPTSSSIHRDGWSGRRYHADGGVEVDVIRKAGGLIRVIWLDDALNERVRTWRATVTYEEQAG